MGTSLLYAGYKLYTVIINAWSSIITALLLGNQPGFRKGRSYCDKVSSIIQITEKRRVEYIKETHIIFIYLGNTFDWVNKRNLLLILGRTVY